VPDTDQGDNSPTTPSHAVAFSDTANADALREILTEARTAGFLGPGPIEPHLHHAAGFVTVARQQSAEAGAGSRPRLLDLGSGGGLPGLVIAAEWPAASVVLLDANVRRTEFLRRAVTRCGFDSRVTVVQERAEVSGRNPELRGTFDGVVVRSFGAPGVVAECAAPLLRAGGWVIISEPPGSDEDGPSAGRWPADGLALVGLVPGEFVRNDFRYQILHQRELCPERYPRRDGVPAKRPLF